MLTVLLLLFLSILGYFFWPKRITTTIHHRPVAFTRLPGWDNSQLQPSFTAFTHSCRTFLRQSPDQPVGSDFFHLVVKDWYPACQAALAMQSPTATQTKNFFEQWFKPVEFYDHESVEGLFTGYYLPQIKGNLVKTSDYAVPIYGLPSNKVDVHLGLFDKKLKNRRLVGHVHAHQLLPYYTRAAINRGAIAHIAPVIAWVHSRLDRLVLETEGSGSIQLPDGDEIFVGYAGENGAKYTSIASILIKKGIMTRDNASVAHIRAYFKSHPEQVDPILNQNKSFVFFMIRDRHAAKGAQGVALTPGYSLAVDRKWIPMGMPLWLDTKIPHATSKKSQTFQRLMIAQDTGGAIRGPVRGDIFWGSGDKATHRANLTRYTGHYWLLLPKNKPVPQVQHVA